MRLLGALIAGLLLLSSCTAGADAAGGTAIEVREFSIDPAHDTFAEGAVTLDVTNDGMFSHLLVISRADGEVLAISPLVAPGTTFSATLDLDAGRYQLTCRLVAQKEDGSIVDHFEQGMQADIEVVAVP